MIIEKILPSQFEAIPDFIAQTFISLQKEVSLTQEEAFDIKLVLEEALTNAIKHGNQFDLKRHVTVCVTLLDGRLTISVKDEGVGFNADGVPDPTEKDKLMKTSGRGVYLIKKIMDEVHFKNGGREICMVKKLTNQRRPL